MSATTPPAERGQPRCNDRHSLLPKRLGAVAGAITACVLAAPAFSQESSAPTLTVVKPASKGCQLIGDLDREFMTPTLNQTFSRYGLAGTDLGASFEHAGKVWFLLGDSVPASGNPTCGDSVATSTATDASKCIPLTFLTQSDGHYRSPAVPGVDLGCFDVPLHGVSNGASMYVWFSTNCMSKSVLARSDDDGLSYTLINTLSDCGCGDACVNGQPPTSCANPSCHFVNVSAAIVPAASAGDLPGSGDRVVLFGSGAYRKSDVYLAVSSLATIEDKATLRYFSGTDAATGAPIWKTSEASAAPLFATAGENGKLSAPCVGELSVHYSAPLGNWLALYNCGNRIDGRIAATAWGPFSPHAVVFDPVADGGYCRFMYATNSGCDALSDPGRLAESGGVYGPYAIPRYSAATPDGGALIYFVMSTWNPYTPMLMETVLGQESHRPRRHPKRT
jgi:hypothetical protein